MARTVVNKNGTGDTMTLKDAKEMVDDRERELLMYIASMVDESTDDEEERANALVTFASLIAKLRNASEIVGYLMDESSLKELFGGLAEYVEVVDDGC